MAKRDVFLHLGPAAGATSRHDLLATSPDLAAAGVVVPRVDAATLARADLEIRRVHKAAGLRRKDVEGAWATACRQTWKAASREKTAVAVSVPGFVAASVDQAALALDGLHGMRVHLVVTAPSGPAPDLSAWLPRLSTSSRVRHVPLGADLGAAIAAFAHDVEAERVERKLAKWTARRARLGRRLRRADAA